MLYYKLLPNILTKKRVKRTSYHDLMYEGPFYLFMAVF